MKLIKKVLFLVFLIIAKVLAERKFFGTMLRFPGGINQDNGNFGYGSYQGYNWHRWNNNSINVNQKNGYNVGLGFGNNAFGNTGSRCRSNRGSCLPWCRPQIRKFSVSCPGNTYCCVNSFNIG